MKLGRIAFWLSLSPWALLLCVFAGMPGFG
jgi:hypothetical protein